MFSAILEGHDCRVVRVGRVLTWSHLNSFSMMKEKLGLKRDRFIYQDQAGLNSSMKNNKKKKVKFAILLDGLFICLSKE